MDSTYDSTIAKNEPVAISNDWRVDWSILARQSSSGIDDKHLIEFLLGQRERADSWQGKAGVPLA